MVTRIYGTTVIPSDQITILGGNSIAVSAAFSSVAGIVGGMDVDDTDAEANTGEVYTLSSQSRGEELFGENSELAEQVRLALANGAAEVKAIAVTETDVTTEALVDSGTLENSPVFDPTVHYDQEITVDDGSGGDVTLTIVYDDADVTDAAGADELVLNPNTGTYDAGSTGYEIDYSYGDYEGAIDTLLLESDMRVVAVCSELEEHATYLDTELEARAVDFEFSSGLVGVPSGSDETYTHNLDAPRTSLVQPSRGYVDTAETKQARTVGAFAGLLASKELGSSSTYDTLRGFTGLVDDFRPSEAGSIIDNKITPLIEDGRIFVVKDITTAEDVRFERIYSNEVVDEVAELSHQINDQYIGDRNTDDNQVAIEEGHRTFLTEMRDNNPVMLDGYDVSLSVPETDPNQIDIELAIDVVGVIDTIDVRIIKGDVVQFGGAE